MNFMDAARLGSWRNWKPAWKMPLALLAALATMRHCSGRERHGLFAIHVLAHFERGDGHLLVEIDGRGDDHGIDIFPVEHFAKFGVGLGRVAGRGRGIDRFLQGCRDRCRRWRRP